MNLSQLSQQLQRKGLQISEVNLEDARQLLIQFECELEPMNIVRVAMLRLQHSDWTDAQVVEQALKLQSARQSQQKGYGDEIFAHIEDEIWSSLVESGGFETIAENLRAKGIDQVLDLLKSGQNGERTVKRFNALTSANTRYQHRSLTQDDDIIDAPFTETLEDLDDVISHTLAPASDPPKLLTAGDLFQPPSPPETKGFAKGNGAEKKLLNGANLGGKD